MSDQRLRRLERDAAASPSPESEAALLRERLRAGTLSLERLELAAYCHPPGAYLGGFAPWIVLGWVNGRECVNEARVSGRAVPAGETHFEWCPGSRRYRHPDERARLAWWVAGLSRWGPEVQVRAAVAAARLVLSRRSAELDLWPDSPWFLWGQANRAVEAAEAWLMCPCDHHEDAWLIASGALHMDPRVQSHPYAWVPTGPWTSDPDQAHNREAPVHVGGLVGEGEAPVRAAIQSALISWALGSQG